jgi:hypothetical protein
MFAWLYVLHIKCTEQVYIGEIMSIHLSTFFISRTSEWVLMNLVLGREEKICRVNLM